MTLTVGHIAYANCVPFFHYLRESGFTGRIVPGVPSELNRLLATGAIDISPSSAFEYARNWRNYVLLPGHSISACGPVQSVLLFSPRPLDQIGSGPIDLTPDSASSVNLLRVLLGEYLAADPAICRPAMAPVEELAAQGGSVLVIGDRALRLAAALRGTTQIHDLGELWWRFTGLPFVFALWIVRQEAALAKEAALRRLQEQLGTSRRRAFADLAGVAAHTPERAWMGEAALLDYWRCMSYELEASHLAGLTRYFQLCFKHGLLPDEPPLRFFE